MMVDPSQDHCENCGNPTSLQSWNGPATRNTKQAPAYAARAIKVNKVALFSVLRSVALLLLILFVMFLPIFQREATLDDISLDDLEKFFKDGTDKTTVNFSLFEDLRDGYRLPNEKNGFIWLFPIAILIVAIIYIAFFLIPDIFCGLCNIANNEISFETGRLKSKATSLFSIRKNSATKENWQEYRKNYPGVIFGYYACFGLFFLSCFLFVLSSTDRYLSFPVGPQMAEYTGLSPFIILIFLSVAGAVFCRFMERLESDRCKNKPQTGAYHAYSGICTLLIFFFAFTIIFSPIIQYKYIPASIAELEDDAEKEQFKKQKYVARNISLFEDFKNNGYQIAPHEDKQNPNEKNETIQQDKNSDSNMRFILYMIQLIPFSLIGPIIAKKIPTKRNAYKAMSLIVLYWVIGLWEIILTFTNSFGKTNLNFRIFDICGFSGYIAYPILFLIGVIFAVVMKSREKAKYDI
ncbi:MAG TPA: hypothetical protein DDW30_03250 [Clostridiales bacterium]|nr:hypothetical protein [Clostridiales bacterium]